MKVFQVILGIMMALMLVAPTTVFAQVYTVPTAAPTPPTIGGATSTDSDDGPPSVAATISPAPVSTQYPLYGTR